MTRLHVSLFLAVLVPLGFSRTVSGDPVPSTGGSLIDPDGLVVRADRVPRWEALFQQPDSAWRGADGAYSVAISPTKTLWLYGDTWIALEPNVPGRRGCRMIDNSLAIQEILKPATTATLAAGNAAREAAERPESPAALLREAARTSETIVGRLGLPEFFWGTDGQGRPVAPFLPAHGPGRLWPLSGLRIDGRLFLFFMQVVEAKGGIGAATYGSRILVVDNPDDPPAAWRVEQAAVPFFSHETTGDLMFGAGSFAEGGFVYVYGVREDWRRGPGGRDLILARTPRQAFVRMDFSAWRFFSLSGWTGDLSKAARLCGEVACELSVSFMPPLRSYVCVYSRYGNSPEIHARFAPRPEGPWGPPLLLYKCRDQNWNKGSFYYAAKAHPELAVQGNELVVTHATNGPDIGVVARDLRLYWPRFVRVTLAPRPADRDGARGTP